MCPRTVIGHAEQEKPPHEGRTERRNHRKFNHGKHESEKLVTNFVKNRVGEGKFVLLPENSKVSMIQPFEKPIYVAKPFLSPLDDFCEGLKEIWGNHWLTNNGPIVRRFAQELSNYFETDNVCLFTNGMLALQIGLQGMEISGEVITTPFTFVATTHSLFWNKTRPVFVDIEPDFYTLDPNWSIHMRKFVLRPYV